MQLNGGRKSLSFRSNYTESTCIMMDPDKTKRKHPQKRRRSSVIQVFYTQKVREKSTRKIKIELLSLCKFVWLRWSFFFSFFIKLRYWRFYSNESHTFSLFHSAHNAELLLSMYSFKRLYLVKFDRFEWEVSHSFSRITKKNSDYNFPISLIRF